ncbi:hypothetical protein KEM48_004161 [Puccinia striiformis f. sp. tritici PST-130]|nr:hypothetical protein KEM48_004161 [Puccinia striiformis f. sp. tritici PST-130]
MGCALKTPSKLEVSPGPLEEKNIEKRACTRKNWESPQPLKPDENADLSFVNPPRAAVMPFDGQSPLAVGLQSPNFQSPNLGTRATQDVRDSAVLPKLRREHNRLEFRNPDNATDLAKYLGYALTQYSQAQLSFGMANISNLPNEVLELIFQAILLQSTRYDLVTHEKKFARPMREFRLVCRRWSNLITDRHLYQTLVFRRGTRAMQFINLQKASLRLPFSDVRPKCQVLAIDRLWTCGAPLILASDLGRFQLPNITHLAAGEHCAAKLVFSLAAALKPTLTMLSIFQPICQDDRRSIPRTFKILEAQLQGLHIEDPDVLDLTSHFKLSSLRLLRIDSYIEGREDHSEMDMFLDAPIEILVLGSCIQTHLEDPEQTLLLDLLDKFRSLRRLVFCEMDSNFSLPEDSMRACRDHQVRCLYRDCSSLSELMVSR